MPLPFLHFRLKLRILTTFLCTLLLPGVLLQTGRSTAQTVPDTPPAARKAEFVRFLYQPPLISQPMVWARINGSKPLLFVVDTGFAPSTTLFPWVAKEAGIDATLYDGKKSGEGEYEQQQVRLGTIHLLPFGDNRSAKGEGIALQTFTNILLFKKDVPILNRVVLPDGTIARAAGFIGASAFDGSVVTFDFARKRLSVQDRATFTVPQKAVTIALKQDDLDHPDTTRWQVPVRIGEKTQWLILDTGSDSTFVTDTDGAGVVGLRQTLAGFMGDTQHDLYVTSELHVGDTVVRNVPLLKDTDRPTGLLGMNILSAFTVSLDSGKRELYLAPRTASPVAAQKGNRSVTLETRRNAAHIAWVLRNSAAFSAGLRVGDKLISVDGVPVGALTLEEAGEAVNGQGSTRAILIVERDGKRRIFSYQRPCLVEFQR